MTEAFIIAYGRSPIVKGRSKGAYYYDKPEDIAAQVLKGVIKRAGSQFPKALIDDVIVGCSVPENLQGMNIARKISLLAGLSQAIPAQTINRFCASGLQSIAAAANAIIAGEMDIVVAGGIEFASTTPATSPELTNNLKLEQSDTPYSTWMGITAENVAEAYDISFEEQNDYALKSHQKAAKAQKNGYFDNEIIPVVVQKPLKEQGKLVLQKEQITLDDGIRFDASLEKMKGLPRPFKKNGSVTAATSSQISDGAAFVILVSKKMMDTYHLQPLARWVTCQTAGLSPDFMGMGPVEAVPKALKKAQLTLDQIAIMELNEAFASQTLACIKTLALDKRRVNVNGGAIALGHANGATGTVLTIKTLSELARRQERYGLMTLCIGGGMGAAAIIEYLGGCHD